MRIMCLNAWGGTLGDDLLPYLADAQPDVLCLQEVIHTPATDKPILVYRDAFRTLDQRTNLLSEICAVLPDHWVTFAPCARGDLWDGDMAVPSFWGLATWVKRDIPVIAQAQDFVHGHYSADGFGEHPRSRTGHAVRIYDHDRGRPVSITQMHGLRDSSGKGDTPERAAQVERLWSLSQKVTEPGDLAVICGDFNVLPGSRTLAYLLDHSFTELVTARNHGGDTHVALYQKREVRRLHADQRLGRCGLV